VRLQRAARFARTRVRELRMIVMALVSTKHPILVHIIPMRRCNLACTYCNEFDDVSTPVPLDEMKRRLDLLAEMGTSIITISGGEPLMHPEIDEVIRHIRRRGIIAGMITNGFFLNQERIERLNRGGLEHLQISIDNVTPDEVSKKSLKTLDGRLEMLAQHAVFQVNINSVLGSGVKNPEDALQIAHRAVDLGFTSTVGIIHDNNGQLKPLGAHEQNIFEEIMELAMPVGIEIFIYLRARLGALVFATARLSRNSAGAIYAGDAAPRIFHGEILRAAMHRFLRAAGGHSG
jgi:MoaA/NifB/PqqE/SkfB family radical SAM enzyme